MKSRSNLVLVFSVLSAVFFLLLVFFRIPFPLYPLMSWQDVLDLLTPLVLVPIYWTLFLATQSGTDSKADRYIFMVLAAVWVLGHGLHLSANSVNNLAEAMARDGLLDILESDIYKLTYFYDEYLSHVVWHTGVLGLAALLMLRAWRSPTSVPVDWLPVAVGGALYGFTLFAIVLEGQTTIAGFPFMALMGFFGLLRGRGQLKNQPVFSFFIIAFWIAVLLFSGWGLYWKGFPQFTDVGLI